MKQFRHKFAKTALISATMLMATAVWYSAFVVAVVTTDTSSISVAAPSQDTARITFSNPDLASLQSSVNVAEERDNTIAHKHEIATSLQAQTDHAYNYLVSRGSPMAPYASVIVEAANRCGGNYKVLLAIAVVESNAGLRPYKLYNPYGYLNGTQYSGWAEALSTLSCRISEQYISVYGTDFVAMGQRYAGSSRWAEKMERVYSSI